jgi:GAF domain-containing protein
MSFPFPIPPNEKERLATLEAYRILDTQPEERFDDLTRLAGVICGTRIALMTILDHGRQWFKSKIGVSISETPRAMAFCTHAIMQRDVFVVSDASKDPLFTNNPLVTSDPNVRFYAGAPLVTRNHSALGTICVLDDKPKELSKGQLEALTLLSRQAMAQLELSYDLEQLRDALAQRDKQDAERKALFSQIQEIHRQLSDVTGALQKFA